MSMASNSGDWITNTTNSNLNGCVTYWPSYEGWYPRYYPVPVKMKSGWVCPVCGTGVSPKVKEHCTKAKP